MNKFKLTWHEHQNGHLVQLVSSNLHSVKYGGFSHLGGISILKKIEEARLPNSFAYEEDRTSLS